MKLEHKFYSIKLNDKLTLLDERWKNNNFEKLYNEIISLFNDEIIYTESTPKRLKPIVENFIVQQNYFIDNLMGELDYYQWNLVFEMIDFAKKYGFEASLKTHIDNLKRDDKSSELRYQVIIKQFV